MFDVETIPDRLAIFPLSGAVLLPNGVLPLNIFEPRYLAMTDDTLKTDHRMIGMIQPLRTNAEAFEEFHPVGCMGRITSFSETPDGRYQIALSGITRFRLKHVEKGFHPYLLADIDRSKFMADLDPFVPDEEFDPHTCCSWYATLPLGLYSTEEC